jgi:hypothetical protein
MKSSSRGGTDQRKDAEPQRGEAATESSAGFPTCCIADFQSADARRDGNCPRVCGLEIRDTAGWKRCATTTVSPTPNFLPAGEQFRPL